MLAKKNRLHKTKDINLLFVAGRAYYTPLLGARGRPNGLAESRLAILISKKVSKRAVVRNRLKRQLRAAFKALLPLPKPSDVVIICLPPLAAAAYQEISQSLTLACQKACHE